LLQAVRRGFFAITDRGRSVLEQDTEKIDRNFLEQFPEFLTFIGKTTVRSEADQVEPAELATTQTPVESLEIAYGKIRSELKSELVARLRNESPAAFERIVIELLVKMGYGGSRADAGKAIGQSGDEGLDGLIKEDRLGLDIVYIQAKRWTTTVGRPEIRKFACALHGQHAHKGIFITTSDFSRDASEYVSKIERARSSCWTDQSWPT
jgi:restriction system protein